MTILITAKMPCRNCGKEIWCNQIKQEATDCPKKKCWLRKHKALVTCAEVAGCDLEDFLVPDVGAIKIHDEPYTHTPVFSGDNESLIDKHYSMHGYGYDC